MEFSIKFSIDYTVIGKKEPNAIAKTIKSLVSQIPIAGDETVVDLFMTNERYPLHGLENMHFIMHQYLLYIHFFNLDSLIPDYLDAIKKVLDVPVVSDYTILIEIRQAEDGSQIDYVRRWKRI